MLEPSPNQTNKVLVHKCLVVAFRRDKAKGLTCDHRFVAGSANAWDKVW